MDHYRLYLRAELRKLGNDGDAAAFLVSGGCAGLPRDTEGLASMFSSRVRVDEYVASLDPIALPLVTACCGRWRGNGIEHLLRPTQEVEFLDVPIEMILLNPAEPYLNFIFERHRSSLAAIARDRELLTAPAYVDHTEGDDVEVRECLAKPEHGRAGMYRIFDGMHRAIQMVRNRDSQIRLCIVREASVSATAPSVDRPGSPR